jgi:hypothetical protein
MVNAVWRNNPCLLCESYETHKFSLLAKCKRIDCYIRWYSRIQRVKVNGFQWNPTGRVKLGPVTSWFCYLQIDSCRMESPARGVQCQVGQYTDRRRVTHEGAILYGCTGVTNERTFCSTARSGKNGLLNFRGKWDQADSALKLVI